MALNEVVVYSDINKELPIAQTSTLNIKKIVNYFRESNQDEGFLPERKKEFQSFLISPDGNYFVIIIRQFLFEEAVQIIQYCAIVYCIEGKIIYRGKWQDYTFSYKCIIYKFSEDSQLFLCCGTEEILILKLKNLKEMNIKLQLSELEDVLFFNDQYIYYRQGWNHIIKYSIQKQEKELIFKHKFVNYSIYFDKDLVIIFSYSNSEFFIYHLKTQKLLRRNSITFAYFEKKIIFKKQFLIMQSKEFIYIQIVMSNKLLRRMKRDIQAKVEDIEINQSVFSLSLREVDRTVWNQFDLLQGIFTQFISTLFIGDVPDKQKSLQLTKKLAMKMMNLLEIEYTVFNI